MASLYVLEEMGIAGRILPRWELRYQDVVTTKGRFNPPDPRLVYLGIDSASVSLSELDLQTLFADVPPESLEARALQTMAAGWPWPREIYALIAERLFQAGTRTIVFDLLFPKAAPGDDAFRGAIERFPGRIVLGSNFVPEAMGARTQGWNLAEPTGTIVPLSEQPAAAVGYVNFWPDFDGTVRRVDYHKTLDQLLGAPALAAPTPETPAALAMRAAMTAGLKSLDHPFAPRRLRFSGPPGTFDPQPVYQIFAPQYWARNFESGAAFHDKIVLIGP
ncbi:MAG TPA: CHASE2 domain-containing protein, partial [Burkholderiales bacterium]|nr:CHASE2 domain-containing protein [Burkholderiales bacterium]